MYSSIAKYYDLIFPFNRHKYEFLKEYAGRDVLDLACATGVYAHKLADDGYNVIGVDLDQSMIQFGKNKGKALLEVADMQEEIYDFYDLIYCIGNSIVHLEDERAIKRQLKNIYQGLKRNGTSVVQIVNYDRIYLDNIESLPIIDNDGVKFERKYTLGDRVKFETKLVADEEITNSVVLYPIRSGRLIQLFDEVGFKDIEVFGSFNRDIFDINESFHLIVVAKKSA